MKSGDTDIIETIGSHFASDLPAAIGIAVSGGGDSMALLHILAKLFATEAVTLHAVTVDHGLREGSGAEATAVADFAESLGIAHTTLRWRDPPQTGNLQDNARRARYTLMTEWAQGHQISMIALGHTADDQAETVLMRLARSSGVSGLAAMSARRTINGITLMRPMLGLTRTRLRSYLRDHGIAWVEDPSNEDLRFDRIKARRAMAALAPLGITAQGLAEVAGNMAQVRQALDWYCFLAARDIAYVDGGDVVIDVRGFRILPDETARRLLVGALIWIASADYGPRRHAMKAFLQAARNGQSATLAGCRLQHHGRQIWISREYNAVRDHMVATDGVWDHRWRLHCSDVCDDRRQIGPLRKEGLAQMPNWRETGRPYAALLASPAVWQNNDLVAAPFAGWANGWCVELLGGEEDFFSSLLSH